MLNFIASKYDENHKFVRMKLTFLGTGTSQGVPVIACDCEVCLSDDPRDKRLRSSVMITVDDTNYVIDAGPDFRQQMLREKVRDLRAILFTHEHKDHVAGLDDVRAFNFKHQKSMDVYADTNVQKALHREYPYIFAAKKYPGVPSVDIHLVDKKNPFYIDSHLFIPIEVLHYKLPVLGYRIGGLTYITDAKTISRVEIESYPGADNDVTKVVQSMPGLSPSVGGFRNDIIIRGGAPNETVYYLDEIEIPNINHFSTQGSAGGPQGMINISFIDEVTLSTSAFGVEYDNPLSGVLQFNQKNGNPKELSGNFRFGASDSAITIEGPLSKEENNKTTFIFSARKSYLQFLFKLIGLPIRPDYWDFQGKINHKIDDYNSINIIGLGAIDDF